MRIVVAAGDGIGPEITAATLDVLGAASEIYDLDIETVEEVVGYESLRLHQTTVRPELLEQVKEADGMILGPTSTRDFLDESNGEVNPSMYFRKRLDLYANVRPSRTYANTSSFQKPFDLVVVRENTEGFYADRNMESGNGELLVTPDVAISLRRITRRCCERVAHAAFALAMQRTKHVTIVHKANVLKIGDGMFLSVCQEVGRQYPEVRVDDVIIDAMMARTIREPALFDVIVTTNMFGDILSDLTAEFAGSLGLGASLNMGDHYAMAQASHGSAPDIAGQDIANPMSLIVSTALLLDWHGRRHELDAYVAAGKAISRAVEDAVTSGRTTGDLGGRLGTREVGAMLSETLEEPVV